MSNSMPKGAGGGSMPGYPINPMTMVIEDIDREVTNQRKIAEQYAKLAEQQAKIGKQQARVTDLLFKHLEREEKSGAPSSTGH